MYHLQEGNPPAGYTKEDIEWNFMFVQNTDPSDTATYRQTLGQPNEQGVYEFFIGDIMKVPNDKISTDVSVVKRWADASGNVTSAWPEGIDSITVQLMQTNGSTIKDVNVNSYYTQNDDSVTWDSVKQKVIMPTSTAEDLKWEHLDKDSLDSGWWYVIQEVSVNDGTNDIPLNNGTVTVGGKTYEAVIGDVGYGQHLTATVVNAEQTDFTFTKSWVLPEEGSMKYVGDVGALENQTIEFNADDLLVVAQLKRFYTNSDGVEVEDTGFTGPKSQYMTIIGGNTSDTAQMIGFNGDTIDDTQAINMVPGEYSQSGWAFNWYNLPAVGYIGGHMVNFTYKAVEKAVYIKPSVVQTVTGQSEYVNVTSRFTKTVETPTAVTNTYNDDSDSLSVTVKKVWVDSNGNPLTNAEKAALPSGAAVTVKLVQASVENAAGIFEEVNEGITVTVRRYSWDSSGEKWCDDILVKGAEINDDIIIEFNNNIAIYNKEGTNIRNITIDGNKVKFTAESKNVTLVVQLSNTPQSIIGYEEGTAPNAVPDPTIGTLVATANNPITLNSTNNWKHTWSNLPKQDEGGNPIYYYIVEDSNSVPSGYTVEYEMEGGTPKKISSMSGTLTVKNKGSEESKTSISITKTWAGDEDDKSLRPTAQQYAAMVKLYVGDTEIPGKTPTVTDNDDNTYTVTYSDLPTYDSNKEKIIYKVIETPVDGYEADKTEALDGETITNTKVKNGSLRITKAVTIDGEPVAQVDERLKGLADGTYYFNVYNSDGTTLATKADGSAIGDIIITVTNGVAVSAPVEVTDLAAGDYVIKEDQDKSTNKAAKLIDKDTSGKQVSVVAGVTGTSAALATLTNDYDLTSLTVEKAWKTTWPTDVVSVQATISATGTDTAIGTLIAKSTGATTAQVDLTSSSATKTWNNLPVYDNAGNKIAYSVAETSVTMTDGTVYTAETAVKLSDVFTTTAAPQDTTTTITNTPVTTHVPVDKAWLFADNSNTWPADVTVVVNLMKQIGTGNKEVAATVTLDSSKTSHDFTNLPKYKGMNEIVYTVEEGAVTGGTLDISKFDVTVSGNAAGFHITNTEKKAGLTITKIVTGKTVALTQEEKAKITFTITGDASFQTITKTLNDFTESNGTYTLTLDQSNGIQSGKAYTVTETGANLEKYTRVTTIESTDYQQSAENEINPTAQVTVDATSGQGSVTVTNTYTGEKVPVEVTKSWAKPDDLPENSSITVELSATVEGKPYVLTGVTTTQTLSATTAPAWYYKWENLPKYDDAEKLITYSVTETGITIAGNEIPAEELDSYKIAADETNTDYHFYLKNQIPTLTKTALKSWSQNTLPENTSVTLKITATTQTQTEDIFEKLVGVTGNQEQTLTGTDATYTANWTANWSNLPKYYKGEEITYTISETEYKIGTKTYTPAEMDAVIASGYDASFTNALPTTERHATKQWVDNNDANHKRPASITFTLSGTWDDNGTAMDVDLSAFGVIAEKTISPDTNGVWPQVDWTNLPVYTLGGKLITYGVEESAVTGYTPTYVWVEDTKTWTVTNTEETVNIPVSKVWGTGAWPEEVDSVKVGLYTQANSEADLVAVNDDNGQPMTVTLTSAQPNTFSNLPKYRNGELITYKVQEIEVVVTTQDNGQKTYTMESEPKVTDVFTVTYVHPDAGNSYNATVTNAIGGTSINLLKVVQGTETPISGAKFTLTKKSGEAYSVFEEAESDANGEIVFNGLEVGEYRLEETHIPTGYLRTSSGRFIYFKVDASGVSRIDSGTDAIPTSDSTVTYDSETTTFTVGNTPGAALPATGGPGTTLYYVAGSALLLLALALLLFRKKQNYD